MKKALIFILVISGLSVSLAHESAVAISTRAVAATTWHVTKPVDDGSMGTLSDALSKAQSGDAVVFDFTERMDMSAALVVPAGVSVGAARNQACVTDYHNALVNIYVNAALNPAMSLGAGATLRNVNFLHIPGPGNVSVRVTGADVDVCGVGLGIGYDGDGNTITQPPGNAAIIVDAPNANIHRNDINGPVIVTENGSGTHIGDDLTGSGRANRGYCGNQGKCAVSLLKTTTKAAHNVIVRDPFPRALAGIVGTGTLGGDDVISHTNHWAQTPEIVSALTSDNFASVIVKGTANPKSLVDIFFDDGVASLTRQSQVMADASGVFTFTGALPGANVFVIAISTLNDPAQAARIGSSSQWSGAVLVSADLGGPTATATQTSTPTSTSAAGTSTATATATPTPTDGGPPSTTPTPTATGTQPVAISPTPGEPEIELEHEAWDAIVPYSSTKELEESVPITFPSGYETTTWTTSVTTTDGLNWLSATAGGTGNGVVVIHVNPVGLPPGVYQGSIGINPAKAQQRALALRSATLSVTFSVFMVNHHLYLPLILR